jgi:hypothetical protein
MRHPAGDPGVRGDRMRTGRRDLLGLEERFGQLVHVRVVELLGDPLAVVGLHRLVPEQEPVDLLPELVLVQIHEPAVAVLTSLEEAQ